MDEYKEETMVITSYEEDDDKEPTQRRQDLVSKILARVNGAKGHHKDAFERMERDMDLALKGFDEREWDKTKYTANVINRHIQQRTAALYAKNPKARARRRQRLDYQIWDGDPIKLKQAYETRANLLQAPELVPPQYNLLVEEYEFVQDKRDWLPQLVRLGLRGLGREVGCLRERVPWGQP